MQLLRSLLKQISYESVRGDDDRKITDICCHSEKVKEGSLFVCINGYRNNGHEYVPQAVEHGAAVLVVDDRYVIEKPVWTGDPDRTHEGGCARADP